MRYARDGFSAQEAAKKGRKAPDWYLDEPELLPGDEFFLQEFWILDTERVRSGGALGPIPVSRIEARAEERHELTGEDCELYVALVRALDDGFLEWKAAEYRKARGAVQSADEEPKPDAAAPRRTRRS